MRGSGCVVLAALMACVTSIGLAAETRHWTSEGRVARTQALKTSDGNPASLEVRCDVMPPTVQLHHRLIDALPERRHGSPLLDRTVLVTFGWNLDPENPHHYGATEFWRRCPAETECLQSRDGEAAGWTRKRIASGWSAFARFTPPRREQIELQFSFVGSRRAIEAACGNKTE